MKLVKALIAIAGTVLLTSPCFGQKTSDAKGKELSTKNHEKLLLVARILHKHDAAIKQLEAENAKLKATIEKLNNYEKENFQFRFEMYNANFDDWNRMEKNLKEVFRQMWGELKTTGRLTQLTTLGLQMMLFEMKSILHSGWSFQLSKENGRRMGVLMGYEAILDDLVARKLIPSKKMAVPQGALDEQWAEIGEALNLSPKRSPKRAMIIPPQYKPTPTPHLDRFLNRTSP
jgi:hypothetical protein